MSEEKQRMNQRGNDDQRPSKVEEAKHAVREQTRKCASAMISAQFLLAAGLICSVALMVEGGLCFALCSANVRNYILSFYYIVFGLLSIGAELRFKLVAKYLRILFSYSGRGLFYLFLGSIALGGEWWAIFIACTLLFLGVLSLFAACVRGKELERLSQRNSNPIVDPKDIEITAPPSSADIGHNSGSKEIKSNADLQPNPFEDY